MLCIELPVPLRLMGNGELQGPLKLLPSETAEPDLFIGVQARLQASVCRETDSVASVTEFAAQRAD